MERMLIIAMQMVLSNSTQRLELEFESPVTSFILFQTFDRRAGLVKDDVDIQVVYTISRVMIAGAAHLNMLNQT
jgi:hypothetical protein